MSASRTTLSAFVLVALLTLTIGCSTPNDEPVTVPADESSAQTSMTVGVPGGYAIVDTNQTDCYGEAQRIDPPAPGSEFYGQDAQIDGDQPSYKDNGDGTVTDDVTGLMWTQTPDLNGDGTINAEDKLSYQSALASAEGLLVGGYDDWRVPTIKELYSLIEFSGVDTSDPQAGNDQGMTPFLDTSVFGFGYGDTSAGERIIDAQFASSTRYVSTTMGGNETMFGVNFADGRIKGYPSGPMPGRESDKTFYVLFVRGNPDYGYNDFVDNGDGTITDQATGLMWMQADSGEGMDWGDALAWAQVKNAEELLGYSDWRVPNAKELQSIVDYRRAPDVTDSAAIDPLFAVSEITNEAGQLDYPCYWSSTTHVNESRVPGAYGAYVAFGRALGYMNGSWMDVHGAGAQRSDPKVGSASQWPTGHGPQGDAIRIKNYVRLVRNVAG